MKIFVIMTEDPKAIKEMIEKLHYIKITLYKSKFLHIKKTLWVEPKGNKLEKLFTTHITKGCHL